MRNLARSEKNIDISDGIPFLHFSICVLGLFEIEGLFISA
jgi:hypothetical protein